MSEPALTPDLIWNAYMNGWFPMAEEDGTLAWYQPQMRALFPIEGVHVSRSLAKKIRRLDFEVRFDTQFAEVVWSCRRPEGNWINEEILRAFVEIHEKGWAHSVEIWRGDDLIGGLYGLALGGCFSAESTFRREDDASKIAIWAAVEHCRKLGFTIFDAQVMNPHLERMGAYEVPIAEFIDELSRVAHAHTPWSLEPRRTNAD